MWAAVAGYDVVPAGLRRRAAWSPAAWSVRWCRWRSGMWLRHRRPDMARRVHRVGRRVADVLLAGLVRVLRRHGGRPAAGGRLGADRGDRRRGAACLAPAAVPAFGPPAARRAVAMTTAVRNLSLALFVAAPAGPVVVVTLLAYGLVMYVLSVPVGVAAGAGRRRRADRPATAWTSGAGEDADGGEQSRRRRRRPGPAVAAGGGAGRRRRGARRPWRG